MTATPQMFQKMAMQMEGGKSGTGQSGGWGASDSFQTFGAGDSVPYLNFETTPEILTKLDESITDSAFPAQPRLVGKNISKPISFYDRYFALNRFYYWMFGFENIPVKVKCFKAGAAPWSIAEPEAGTVYTQDAGTNTFTYLRKENVRDTDGNTTWLYIFRDDDTSTPTASGILTEDNDTPTFTYTAVSGVLYEHLYELNTSGRHMRNYTTAEQAVTGWAMGDKLNLMATFGKRMSDYDQRIQNALCKSWSWKVTGGDLSQFDCGYVGYSLDQGDYSSSAWTLPAGLDDNLNVPPSHETQFKLGTIFEGASEDMVSLGLSEATLNVEMALDEIQTLLSGVWLANPIMGDKYAMAMTATIVRHDGQTYETARDNQTLMCAQIISNMGYYMREILIKGATITTAGPDNSKVAAEPLGLGIGKVSQANTPFTSTGHLYGNAEIQQSPILARIRNASAVNEMFAI